jgi:hypothetical protein
VGLYLIHQLLGEALPGDVGASTDRDLAVARRLPCELHCRPYAIGDEDELDSAPRHWLRRSVSHHEMEPLRRMDPAVIFSTHLPPAVGPVPEFLDMLAAAPNAEPFVGPDQHALEEMLAGFEPATAAGTPHSG